RDLGENGVDRLLAVTYMAEIGGCIRTSFSRCSACPDTVDDSVVHRIPPRQSRASVSEHVIVSLLRALKLQRRVRKWFVGADTGQHSVQRRGLRVGLHAAIPIVLGYECVSFDQISSHVRFPEMIDHSPAAL